MKIRNLNAEIEADLIDQIVLNAESDEISLESAAR